jgi:preprotein translocase subunit SecB
MTAPAAGTPEITTHYIRLMRTSFEVDDAYPKESSGRIPVVFEFDVQRAFPTPHELVLVASLALFKNEERAPFRLTVSYEGRFSVDNDATVELLRRFARYNAPGMVLPYLREAVTALTARSGIGSLVMPPVNIQRLVDSIEKKREGAESHTSGGPKFG